MEDCSIHIDKEWWDDHGDEEREATLTHELYHFMPKADKKNGGWKLDDAGRLHMGRLPVWRVAYRP